MAIRRASVVEVPEIAVPCGESWEGMPGSLRVRHCDVCGKDVHNLAAMSGAEIARMMSGALPCMRIVRDRDGALVTTEPVQTSRVPAMAAGLLTVAMAFGSAAAQSAGGPPPGATMGVPPMVPVARVKVSGRVQDHVGRVVAGVRVKLLAGPDVVGETVISASGRFTMAAVPGRYELELVGDGIETRKIPLTVEKDTVLKQPLQVTEVRRSRLRPAPPLMPARPGVGSVAMGFLARPAVKEETPPAPAPAVESPKYSAPALSVAPAKTSSITMEPR